MALRYSKSISPTFHFIYNNTLIHHRINHNTPTIVRFIETQSTPPTNSNFTEKQALTIAYLTNSCGLSLESAISASKRVNIKSTEKPDSVLELLRSHGFAKNHISRLFSTYPTLILADPERTLRPKIEYFESLGVVGPDLPKIICSSNVLQNSLEHQIIPTCDFLKRYIRTDENLIYVLKRCSRVVMLNVEKVLVPKIHTLRAHGVPESHIGKLIMLQPGTLGARLDVFKEVTDAVTEMGFDPKTRSYLVAVSSMSAISKLNWEKKKEAYMSFGWSESEFNSAFKLQPMCVLSSEKKIRKLMDFFLNKAGLRASETVKCPTLFLTSLERRIIPRCSVLQVLMSRGLIGKDDVDVVWVLGSGRKCFETRFLTKYKDVAPEVIKAYEGEIGFQGFDTKL
ncbi:transcription termination factor MTERF6, chloroplastic/mitochondrial-like [Cornus florida]|uniref:transcription termination factor MTERF6, chloroplastic/mitochondrial-like n=1 Tax=Cornus florida TaxID=4283 RepID=UPI0028A2D20F|nr:transcription termination factor MTERF6, chloroplastic/mitochondrial-like [Cornus florida]